MVPAAAAAANAAPCSRARINATGAEVRGSPTSQPLTAGPQRRPARLAARIRAGVRATWRTRVVNPPGPSQPPLASPQPSPAPLALEPPALERPAAAPEPRRVRRGAAAGPGQA